MIKAPAKRKISPKKALRGSFNRGKRMPLTKKTVPNKTMGRRRVMNPWTRAVLRDPAGPRSRALIR
jgi:hypothetical protein